MKLRYRDISNMKYEVAEDWSHQTDIKGCACKTDFITLDDDGLLTVKAGYFWNGASGPTFDSESSMRGSLLHDALYECLRRSLLEQSWREHIDNLLYRTLLEDGMNPIRAQIWFSSVRAFAGPCAKFGTQPEDTIYEVGKAD